MSCGYLIATRFEVLYRRAIESERYKDNEGRIYGVPLSDIRPETVPRKYRGIDRDPVSALTYEAAAAFSEAGYPAEATASSALLDEIDERDCRDDGWVTSFQDIVEVWRLLGSEQSSYELIFGKEFDDPAPAPHESTFLGCDAAHFAADHFSCICDSMFFPRWHGTDPQKANAQGPAREKR